ncbi:MAG TPA: diaminopimelate epimerase [Terriglobales bacterium]|nr:diaminopimelate epimerase [Terriglobales bacterium]
MPPVRSVPFTKASACGNDFLIIDAVHRPSDAAGFTGRICDRHNGIGADGVEWVSATPAADIEAQLINADGSPAEISGNGTRCVAAYWLAKQSTSPAMVRVLTGAGIKECRPTGGATPQFEFEMKIGVPEILGELELDMPTGKVKGLNIWMGNPQFVVFVEHFDFHWQVRGAVIQSQSAFPEGTNVDFVRILGPHEIESRFFERGAGETQSSGTGSCASAVAAIHAKGVMSPVTVKAPGGSQIVRWHNDIYLQGPARLVGEGQFFI